MRRTDLPRAQASLVGRGAELREARRRLTEGARCLTLRGPAGIGKTRVAMALASELALKSEVRWVDLVAKRSEEEIALAVLSVLGVSEGDDLDSILYERVRASGVLTLFLDNCEQAAEVLAITIDRLLRTAAQLTVVATSRVALRLSYESVLELGPLASVDDATALFEQRAFARRGSFSTEERERVVAIVNVLDRIPLAIELAAARTGTLSLEELQDRLAEDLSILSDRARDRPARQRDFKSAVTSSFELLDPTLRLALGKLALLRGGFGLAAATAVLESTSPGIDTMATIDELAQASLLVRVDQGGLLRFRMYECLRQCAYDEIDEEVRARTMRALAKYLAASGSRLTDWKISLDEGRLRELRADLENYRTTWSWLNGTEDPECLAYFVQLGCVLGSIYLAQGPLVESLRILSETVEVVRRARATLTDDLLSELFEKRGYVRSVCRDPAATEDLETARRHAPPDRRGAVLRALAKCLCDFGDPATALGHAEAALALARESGDPADTTLSLFQFAAVKHGLADSAGALEAIDSAITLEEEHSPAVPAAMYHALRGEVLHELGRFPEADGAFEVAVVAARARRVLMYAGRFAAAQAFARFEARTDSCRALVHSLSDTVTPESDLVWCLLLRSIAAVLDGNTHALAANRVLLARAKGPALASARAILECAQALLSSDHVSSEHDLPSHDYRARILCRMVAARRTTQAPTIALAADGSWFIWQGTEVDLTRRPLLRRILSAIAEASGAPVHRDELVRVAWPGEKLIQESAYNRLRVAVSELRSLGLRDAVVGSPDGYSLARDVSVSVRAARPPRHPPAL